MYGSHWDIKQQNIAEARQTERMLSALMKSSRLEEGFRNWFEQFHRLEADLSNHKHRVEFDAFRAGVAFAVENPDIQLCNHRQTP